jgi:HK97 family phage portal protein
VNTFNLEAKRHTSRVLAEYAQSRPGAAQRMADVVEGSQLTRISNAQVYSTVSSDNDAMNALFQPIASASGFAVTDKTAMAVSTVYACLSKLAGAVLQLPVGHYRCDKEGERFRVENAPLWWMLNESPNALWTAASWKEWIVRCVNLRGDQHTRILRSTNNSGGQVIGLQPLHPDLVVPRLVPGQSGHRLVYDTIDPYTGKMETVDQDDMLHFAGFGFNGLHSISAIQYAAKQSIGNSLAAAEFTGRTIGEGAMPQIALEYPNKMVPEQAKLLRDSFVATYTGVGARKLPLVLTEGGKVSELSISPVDLQLIESRRYEKEDICQALGVPPIIIGDSDKASSWGTGIEQITLGFVKFTIKPMLCRWQEELNRKLFRNAGQFVVFELDGLLAGDSKAQNEGFKSALGGPGTGDGYMTVNEVRRLKNLPRIEGGDELFKAQRGTTAKPTTPPEDGAPA